jgi:uncharacterized protein YjiS (DUF1127 family)
MKTLSQTAMAMPLRHSSWWRQGARLVALWRRRAQERRALAVMDERSLRDIGISRLDALYEANKPVWRG